MILAPRMLERGSAAWLAALSAAEVPCGAVRDIAEVLDDPQVIARDMVETVDHPTIGPLRLTGIPFKLSDTPGSIRRPPPLLGEHTDEVLSELGYSGDEIVALRRDGIV